MRVQAILRAFSVFLGQVVLLGCWSLAGCDAATPAGGTDTTGADVSTADAAADVPYVPVDPHSCPHRCGAGQIYVLDQITLLPVDASGVAAGFDLDGYESTYDTEIGCGFADLHNSLGEGGVDNQFAAITKLLPSQVGDTLPAALATSIAAGGLTMLFEEVGPAGVADGKTPAALVVRKGTGVPLLGTDGKLLEDQSFGLEPSPVLAVVDNLVQDGAGVRGGPLLLHFRMLFVDKNLGFDLRHARLRYEPDGNGGIRGEVGGIVNLKEVMGLVDLLGGCDQPLHDQLADLVPNFADSRLEPGGPCEAFSMGFGFHGVPAHLMGSVTSP